MFNAKHHVGYQLHGTHPRPGVSVQQQLRCSLHKRCYNLIFFENSGYLRVDTRLDVRHWASHRLGVRCRASSQMSTASLNEMKPAGDEILSADNPQASGTRHPPHSACVFKIKLDIFWILWSGKVFLNNVNKYISGWCNRYSGLKRSTAPLLSWVSMSTTTSMFTARALLLCQSWYPTRSSALHI